MKKNLTVYITITIITLCFATNGYAQLGGVLNKAKDAINKKTEKKEPATQPTKPPTAAEQPVNTGSSSTSGNNAANAPRPEASALGTIYFSNKPFTDGTEGGKTTFSSNESIYGKLVLKGGTVREVLKPAAPTQKIKGYQLPFRIYRMDRDGDKHTLFVLATTAVLSEADLDKSSWSFDVFPHPDQAQTLIYTGMNPNDGYNPTDSVYVFLSNNTTKKRTYRLGVEMKTAGVDFRGNPLPESELQSISGDFSFTFQGADFAAIKANSDKLNNTFFSRYKNQKMANQELPKEWKLTTNPIIGGQTELKLKTTYVNSFSSGGGANLNILKFYAAPPKSQTPWIVLNNDLGIPLYRYSAQWYTVFVKDKSNDVCFFQGFGLRQNYSGGGTFSEAFVDHGDSHLYNCDKMNAK